MAVTFARPERIRPIRIEGCQGCGACILTCPERALRPARNNPLLDPARCTACGECIEICPVDAIGFVGVRSLAAGGDHVPGESDPPQTGRRESVHLEQ